MFQIKINFNPFQRRSLQMKIEKHLISEVNRKAQTKAIMIYNC